MTIPLPTTPMRIAFLTTLVPNTLRTGSEIATRAILSVLEDLGHEVTLFAYGRAPFHVASPVETVLLATIPVESATAPRREQAAWAWRSLRSGLPISSEKYNYLPPDRLEAEIARTNPDLLIVDHVNLYPFVTGLARRLPLGVIFHDVQAISYAMVAENSARPWWRAIYAREARLNARLERRAGAEARFSLFLSEADAEEARTRFGIAAPAVLPLFFPTPPEPAPALAPDYDIGLIGTWSWPPVRQGMAWFLDEVVPRLPPDLSIAVAGSGSETLPAGRVQRLGLVPSARAFLASLRVSAVPTTAGTGVQIKTLELAATGTPAVSTPLGVRGLDGLPETITVADGPQAFADALADAVRRPKPRAAAAGHAWNEARREAARRTLHDALARLP
ncbi:MAG: glycosyltransferase [Methylobacterium sp.]